MQLACDEQVPPTKPAETIRCFRFGEDEGRKWRHLAKPSSLWSQRKFDAQIMKAGRKAASHNILTCTSLITELYWRLRHYNSSHRH